MRERPPTRSTRVGSEKENPLEPTLDPKELRELIEIISRSEFVTFELEREGLRLRLVKGNSTAPGTVYAFAPTGSQLPAADSAALAPAETARAERVEPGIVDFPSPIVGTFFRASSPASPPFVEVGSLVKKGQVLGIVEAMKLMNEIQSEIDGEVVEICVANGLPVEYGQVLFRLRPSGEPAP